MSILLLVPILAPLTAAAFAAVLGWRRLSSSVTVLASFSVLGSGAVLGFRVESGAQFGVGSLLRADALSVTMLIVIGTVGTLATWASIGYINAELAHGHTDRRGANLYGVLVPIFLAAMALAVLANNIGVMWVAIEATTVATAFLVGHRRTRAALEATWKYVVICSVGIALAFLGTVLLYFASLHAGATSGNALNIDVLLAHATRLDPAVTHLAAGLLLLGYGAKAGLVPFHTWLADAHSQAPAPVSALMSGVLLSVAFSALLRIKSVVDLALGTGFLRAGLLIVGLLTLLIAASLLVVQTDFKRMLAYSSMENMGLVAVAAAPAPSWQSPRCCCTSWPTGSARRWCSSRPDSCKQRTTPRRSATSPVCWPDLAWWASRSLWVWRSCSACHPSPCSPVSCPSRARSPVPTSAGRWASRCCSSLSPSPPWSATAAGCCSAHQTRAHRRSPCQARSRVRWSPASS